MSQNISQMGGAYRGPYVLAVDQSTSATKALLFDGEGELIGRSDRSHAQKISENGWVGL